MVQSELYLQEPIHFLRTCTIKNSYLAEMSRNNEVTQEYRDYLPDELLPYYRHMKGEYILSSGTTELFGNEYSNTSLYTKFDTLMQVKSFDTQETIVFTKANLLEHPKTAEWYKIPNSQYFKLCERYPKQTDLIKSIVYPIEDITAAVEAQNFSLLQYDEELLEENERVSILSAMRKFLESVEVRWDVKEFAFEHLYPVAFQGILWDQLYNCISTQRILNIRTSSVHSYHVWEFLKSRGLGDYRDILSTNKALFLYRNIDYLLENQGTKKNFSILIGSLLRDMGVTIQQKALVQQIQGVETDNPDVVEDEEDTSILTTCSPSDKILSFDAGEETIMLQAQAFMEGSSTVASTTVGNFTTAVLAMTNSVSVKTDIDLVTEGTYEDTAELYQKEKAAGLEYTNANLFTMSTSTQSSTFPYAAKTLLLTKVHEITANTGSELLPNLFSRYMEEVLFYRASLNHLNFSIHVDDSVDVDMWLLNGNEALAMMMYASMRAIGIRLETTITKVRLAIPYKETFPEMPTTFWYGGKEYKISDFTTEHGFSDMVCHPGGFADVTSMDAALLQEANNLINNYVQMNLYPTSKCVALFDTVFTSRMARGEFDLNLLDGMTYREYFDDRPEIKEVIEKLDNYADPETAYDELFLTILTSLFPNIDDSYLNQGIISSETLERLKYLFRSLCSYNISFVDNSKTENLMTTTIGTISTEIEYKDVIATHVDRQTIPLTSHPCDMNFFYYDEVFGDDFYCNGSDMVVEDYLDLGTDYIETVPVNMNQLYEFMPTEELQLKYNTQDLYGVLSVDTLLRLIRSLLNNIFAFYVDRSTKEYYFLRAKNCLIENDDNTVIINENQRSYLEQLQTYFEEEQDKVKEEFKRTPNIKVSGAFKHDTDDEEYEPDHEICYYIDYPSEHTKVESPNFLGNFDDFNDLPRVDGNVVYINKYKTLGSVQVWDSRKPYVCMNKQWRKATSEIHEL